ncbi:MAG: SWIM zinc finger family protein [Nitrososphaerales archaeon]
MQRISYLLSEEKESRASKASDLAEVFGAVKQNSDGSFVVASQWTPNKSYRVEGETCTCADYEYRKNVCKHILAVKEFEGTALIPVRA